MNKKYNVYIGIDPGVTTGIGIWYPADKEFKVVDSDRFAVVLRLVLAFDKKRDFFVRIEDARLRKWFGNAGAEQLQGAGSIKRDCGLWQEFLELENIPHEFVAPKNNKTKYTAQAFKRLTGWPERTNEHARDAAMLVFGF